MQDGYRPNMLFCQYKSSIGQVKCNFKYTSEKDIKSRLKVFLFLVQKKYTKAHLT